MSNTVDNEGRKRKLSAKKREEASGGGEPLSKKGKECDRRSCQEVYTDTPPSCFCRATDK